MATSLSFRQSYDRPLRYSTEGLLDELNLLVHPILVGSGMARLFPPAEPSVPLRLLSAQTFKTGILNLGCAAAKD